MKTAEIKELNVAEIEERVDAARENLKRMKINHAVSPMENPTLLRKARRDIARMLTLIEQKKNAKS